MRRLVMLIALLVASAASALPARAQVFNPETFTLANGLQVVVVTNRRAPIVTHMIWYRIGAADEVPGVSGIAHFLEHLMFSGTRQVGAGDFSRRVRRLGGDDGAFTSFDYTAYYQSVAREHLETVMRMEADRMTNLVLSDSGVATELNVILEERRQVVESRPAALMREQVMATLYLNHPYGRPIIGWEHEMRGLGRPQAEAWYRRYYAPNNAVLVVAGDVNAAELRPLVQRIYGPIASRPVPPRVRPQEPPQTSLRRVEFRDARVQSPSWARLWLAPGYVRGQRQHAYALLVLADLLSGGETSRLDRVLVHERSLLNSVSVSYSPDALDEVGFGISATPRPGTTLAAVETAIEEQIALLLRDGVTQAEVARSIARLTTAAIYERDALNTAPRVIGAALTSGQTLADVEAWPNRIAAVTAEQVNAAARAILVPNIGVIATLLPRPGS